MRLQGKIVLVTGSTTGIGEAIARRCVQEGAQVMVHGRDETRAHAVCQDLGDAAAFVLGDLGRPEPCAAIVHATVERFGALHAVVNNAALTTRSNIDTTNARNFDTIIAVNLRAPLLIAQAAVPIFRRQGGGVILNIGSTNALSGEPNLLDYSMAKGGLMTMTRNLANSLAQERIRVNQLNVGWTLTPNEREVKKADGLPEGWEHHVPPVYAPSGRLLAPDEVAAHAVFWLSDESAPINGAVYEVEQYPLIGRKVTKEF